jgi:hypothetical protein
MFEGTSSVRNKNFKNDGFGHTFTSGNFGNDFVEIPHGTCTQKCVGRVFTGKFAYGN